MPCRWTRREFLTAVGGAMGAAWAARFAAGRTLAFPELREAMFYERLADGAVRCRLCPWQCVVPDGKRGRCRVRENRGGTYYSLVYGRPVAIHNDPIEKKPFMHVFPGSTAFSLSTVGCNFRCKFCQNWTISQASPEEVSPPFRDPEAIAAMARSAGAKTVAYTYGEPVVFYEYMYDCAQAARAAGLGNVVVTNGFIAEEPLRKLLPLLTAVKVDLKSFSADYYREICEGRLDPVLETLKRVHDAGMWLEIVVLVVPTLNDREDELRGLASWVRRELGPNVPVHFIRFYPQYKLRHLPATPQSTLDKAARIAVEAGLNFVYATGLREVTTFCPECRAPLVERVKYAVVKDNLTEAKCPKCGFNIPGVW